MHAFAISSIPNADSSIRSSRRNDIRLCRGPSSPRDKSLCPLSQTAFHGIVRRDGITICGCESLGLIQSCIDGLRCVYPKCRLSQLKVDLLVSINLPSKLIGLCAIYMFPLPIQMPIIDYPVIGESISTQGMNHIVCFGVAFRVNRLKVYGADDIFVFD